MNPLELVALPPLMDRTPGRAEVAIGLIDGPVAWDHPDLTGENVRAIPDGRPGRCVQADSAACTHGTFVAGVLHGRRTSPAPAICPGCTLLVRPIFAERMTGATAMPSATPQELAVALWESMEAGARVLNLSVALATPSLGAWRDLEEALDQAVRRGVLVIAAAGNQGTLGSSVVTRHPWVIPVVACDRSGRPTRESNLGNSIGRRGLRAPGEAVTSLGPPGHPITRGGTSVAAPFVTGAVALVWSVFPTATAAEVKAAITQAGPSRRLVVVPPVLNAWAAYEALARLYPTGQLSRSPSSR